MFDHNNLFFYLPPDVFLSKNTIQSCFLRPTFGIRNLLSTVLYLDVDERILDERKSFFLRVIGFLF